MEKKNEVSFDSFYLGPPWLCRNNFEGGRRKRKTLLGSAPASRVFFQKESLCPSSSDPPPFTLRKWADRRDLARNQTRKSNFTFFGGLVVSEIPFQEGPRRTPPKLGAEREWRERERGRGEIEFQFQFRSRRQIRPTKKTAVFSSSSSSSQTFPKRRRKKPASRLARRQAGFASVLPLPPH